MIWLRKLVFYTFFASYLILCPLLIMYALGYFFKPGMEQGIVKTGLIYMTTVPSGASVYFGKELLPQKTPALIRDLIPASYEIRVELAGHKGWSQKLPVEGGKATVVEHILLLPDDLAAEAITDVPVSRLLPVEGSPWIVLESGDSAGKLQAFNYRQDKIARVFAEDHPASREKLAAVHSWPEGRNLLVHTNKPSGGRYWWVDLKEKETEPEDISGLFLQPGERLYHTPQDPRAIFSLQDGTLSRIDVEKKSISPGILTGVRGLGLFNKSIYAVTESKKVLRTALDGEVQETLLRDSDLFSSLFGNADFYKIRIFSKSILLFESPGGKLVSNRLPYELSSSGITGVNYDESKKKAVVWKQDRIGVIDFRDRDSERPVFEHGPRISWVYRGGANIRQAFWVYDASHVLFRDGDSVFLLELETHAKPYLRELFKVRENTDIFYSEDTGKVYFVDPAAKGLAAFELLPRRIMTFFPFPEFEEERKEIAIEEL